MIEQAFIGFRRLLRGIGLVLPRGAFLIILIGGAAILVAVVVIWAVGRKKHTPF